MGPDLQLAGSVHCPRKTPSWIVKKGLSCRVRQASVEACHGAHQEAGDHARAADERVEERQDLAHPDAALRLPGILQHIFKQPHQRVHAPACKELRRGLPCMRRLPSWPLGMQTTS